MESQTMSTTKRKTQSKLQSAPAPKAKVRRRPQGVKPETEPMPIFPEALTADSPKVEKAKKAKVAKPKVEKEAKPPRKAEEAYDIKKNGKMSARGLTCLCGCNAATQTKDARFLSGHDSKMRQQILDGGPVPAIVLPFFEAGEVVAGIKIVKGKPVDCKRAGAAADEGEEEGEE